MFQRLKHRFTVLATVSMLLLMALLVSMMNIINYISFINDVDLVLQVIAQPNAPFFKEEEEEHPKKHSEDFIPKGMSPEVPYESRFFTVMVTQDGDVIEPDFSRIISVDDESAEEYVTLAMESGKEKGFVGQFRYLKTTDDKMTRFYFLDCGRKIDAFKTFLLSSIGVGVLGCLIVFLLFLRFSGKIVKPIAESYEKQRRFISDASHEIKTPLTIIMANTDLLECEGEKDELTEIRHQTERLTELTNSLVTLSRMEEVSDSVQKIEMPLSDIVNETCTTFENLAAANKLNLVNAVEPNITINGSPDSIRRLVSVLLDNAVKYSPEGGTIKLDIKSSKKDVILSVENTSRTPVNPENLKYVFDRFYRSDESRNSETGGHGIGLSIAKAIVDAHGGTIAATTTDGSDFCINVVL